MPQSNIPPHLHWIELSESALLHNVNSIHKLIPATTKICAMVKANAYGHGLEQIAPLLKPYINFYGVNTIAEALTIRGLNIDLPILITGPISTADLSLAIQYNVSLCVHSRNYFNELKSSRVKIHLKVNTGMNRLGLEAQEFPSILKEISSSALQLEGIYTHFHSADLPSSATQKQFSLFQSYVTQAKALFPHIIAHCANTAAIFNYPQTHLDMVRPGIGLYGLWPTLQPVLSWKAQVIQSRLIGTNQSIGYAETFIAKKPTYCALLPIGYSDGLDRHLSNTPPYVGRIAMNFSTIKTLDLQRDGTVVDIIGPQQTATDLAQKLGTINYEIVARLSPNIPRVVVK